MYSQLFGLPGFAWVVEFFPGLLFVCFRVHCLHYSYIKRNDTLLSYTEEHGEYILSTIRNFFLIFPEVQECSVDKTMFCLHANDLILHVNEDSFQNIVFTSKTNSISDPVLGIFTYNIVFYSSVCNLLVLEVL